MSKLTILDNEYATLWYYPETKILHHKIKKFIFGEPLQHLLNTGTEQLKKYGAHKWLSDDRNNNALRTSDAEWSTTVWLPNTAKAGWKYWAIVQPEKISGQMNMKRHASTTNSAGVTVSVFNDLDEAMTWLVNQ
jgi:hypothetical protein